MRKKKQRNKKGMTVVETVVAFVVMALAFTVGMVGIATGANMINSGARLKHNRSDVAEQIENGTVSNGTVTVSNGTNVSSYTMDEYTYNNFKTYKTTTTP
ncbi:MAG: hypothetical protein LIO74_01550 [Ruminococcus sp.]|nr:hypothetical protein [Ruminococcus sp.]